MLKERKSPQKEKKERTLPQTSKINELHHLTRGITFDSLRSHFDVCVGFLCDISLFVVCGCHASSLLMHSEMAHQHFLCEFS